MKTLRYVNLLWFRELMDQAVRRSDDWFRETRPADADGETDHYLLRGNFRHFENFLKYGMLPSFQALNAFQQSLALDALALALVLDTKNTWTHFNNREELLGGAFEISDDPKQFFTSIFDILSAGKGISLSQYFPDDPWVIDLNDTLDLYRHLSFQGDQA